MAKAWIEALADEVQRTCRDAAESYNRKLHRDGIAAAEGKVYFLALVTCLEQDLAEIRSRLQGSAVSCDTSTTKEGLAQVHLRRERFPWYDATLTHNEVGIHLVYTQDNGTVGDHGAQAAMIRQERHFDFRVDTRDAFSVIEGSRAFSPDELSQYILELLFRGCT